MWKHIDTQTSRENGGGDQSYAAMSHRMPGLPEAGRGKEGAISRGSAGSTYRRLLDFELSASRAVWQ